MPYRHLFRQHDNSHDFHGQHAFQGQNPQLSIVDPDSVDYTGWHEMDFTTTPLTSSTLEIDSHQSLGQKYSAAMNRAQQDPLAYLRSSDHRHASSGSVINRSSHPQSSGPRRASGDTFPSSQFSFSQLLNMEANLPSMDQSSLNSSRADDDSNMTNSDLTTTLSASDSIHSSPPMNNLDPIAISIATRTDSTEKLCPLIAGQVDSCQPSRCGPDAPCMNFTTLPPIEECTSVPCISEANNQNETNFTPDTMSVEVHQRPSISARTSTNSISRSSTTRRSSSSNATTTDSQPDIVALPPRRHTATTTRRNTRATKKPLPATTSLSSDNDDEEDLPPLPLKSTAPSKADAKQRAKQAHSLVERKYRENLNAKITQLHSTLQNSHYGPRIGEDGNEQRDDLPASSKVRKSDVLTEAMNYVNQTEVEMRHMENEIVRLAERVRVLEKLVRCEDCSLLKQMVNLQVQVV
ncbi:hypothetical protein H2200_007734 [Cladophialophora chaetospira]|uniref:BHLH domain-containing protein n=1 Tax=Cladophialophora chaetospira TaxID=386627 RepID=A0AA38X6F0_9EURO|nr:hypothetical protein H2200_007734 [Cladophialophora chaetospira]